MAHFDIRNLSFTYAGAARPTLKDVNLSVKHGEYLCLIGPSGCGKTTLLRQLKTVFTPEGERTGTILFNDIPLEDTSARSQSSQIGFVMQDPDAQIVTDKVWHELAFGLESLGIDRDVMRMRVAEMAAFFGITDWMQKQVSELSGGQRQLLNLASIMAMHPTALILDEPTSQLDPIAASDFLNTIRKINVELGTTIIITEHRLENVFSIADRVIVMEDGRISCDATPREVAMELCEQGGDAAYALPTPVRVYYGVTRAPEANSSIPESFDECPLTVREGRNWLTDIVLSHPPSRVAIETPQRSPVQREESALRLKDVWFRHEKDSDDILRGIDLEVSHSTIHAIVGGNGAGKSTLLKCICGLGRPYRGKMDVFERKGSASDARRLAHGDIAMLPQNPQNLFAGETIREELESFLARCDDPPVTLADIAEMFDITSILDAHPFDVSGGELQKAALAMALVSRPRLLLLDEPTKGLDNAFKHRFAQMLDELREKSMTILMVSHDIEFCARHADAASMLFDGIITSTNDPRTFFSQNNFYTTSANRMSRNVFANAITDEDVIELCLS